MTRNVIVITGPTATGKTALGVHLSRRIGGEVVSADSMQVYKFMDIGTAKPTSGEMAEIRHHMLNVVHPSEGYSVSRYVCDAEVCIDDIIGRGHIPIIVGGTGLYIDSLIAGRVFSDRGDAEVRAALEAEYDDLGGKDMLLRLREFDPDSAARLHPNDKKRIVRAFEVHRVTGKSISQHDLETKLLPPKYAARKIALTFSDRDVLYGRINTRVDAMVKAGLYDEVCALLSMGISPESTAMQAIGYKEMIGAAAGRYSRDEAIDKIKTESRRYAKRQLTWLRRDTAATWITWEKEPSHEFVHFDKIFSTGEL